MRSCLIKHHKYFLTCMKTKFMLYKNFKKANLLVQHGNSIKINIGSGSVRGINGWITLDLSDNADIFWNLNQKMPFPDNSVDMIYSSHLFEHFLYPKIIEIMGDCYRILKPDGVFSIAVPNARLYIEGYFDKSFNPLPQDIYQPAFHYNSRIDFINYTAYMGGEHKHMFDEENLLAILRKVGFKNVELRQYDSSIDLQGRKWESIYAKGLK
jgi:predicted SAM-dependent methyltransferase